MEAFNPALGCWETIPSMNLARANAGAVASEGCLAANGRHHVQRNHPYEQSEHLLHPEATSTCVEASSRELFHGTAPCLAFQKHSESMTVCVFLLSVGSVVSQPLLAQQIFLAADSL